MGPATGEIVSDLYHGKQPGYDVGSCALDRFARTDIAAGETNIV
jgi:sarcosine oxidase subunit beta